MKEKEMTEQEQIEEIKLIIAENMATYSKAKMPYEEALKFCALGIIASGYRKESETAKEFAEKLKPLKMSKGQMSAEICRLRKFEKEINQKIESGRLVELPCKLGDKVYEFFKNHRPPFIQETTIEKIIITEKGLRLKLARNAFYETAISSLGKTLFLTREQAEARLKELSEKRK